MKKLIPRDAPKLTSYAMEESMVASSRYVAQVKWGLTVTVLMNRMFLLTSDY
jgi:hypothetical protein